MSNFWDTVWLILMTFVLVAYLLVLFQIIVDLFRDKELGGLSKAIWFIGLVFLPFLTALVYLIARGGGMQKRQLEQAQAMQAAQADYIQSVVRSSSASATEQIASAKSLLDSGTITQAEFDALKAKALA